MDSSSQGGRRGHFHRSRRGPDRRGGERRGAPQQSSEQGPREQARRGDHVDVEQIMRDIRARIGQRPGIDLTDPQVQELAARRLESILDLRSIRPALLEQLRSSAGVPPVTPPSINPDEPPYRFEDTTLYETHNPITRAIRRLLNPVLKLFFNPNPLIRALNIQSRLNVEAARREAERVQQQAEWNALHYEILQRLVTEVSRVSLEIQAMSLQVESLGAKVDFNERRVRGVEGALHQGRVPAGREMAAHVPAASSGMSAETPPSEAVQPGEAPAGEGHQRRRRRRRRGRRGAGPPEAAAPAAASRAMPSGEAQEPEEIDDGAEEETAEGPVTVSTEGEPIVAALEPTISDRQEQRPPPPVAAPAAEPDHPRAAPAVTPSTGESPPLHPIAPGTRVGDRGLHPSAPNTRVGDPGEPGPDDQ